MKAPIHLHDEAKKIWRDIVPKIQELGSLDLDPSIDGHVVEAYVMAVYRHRQASRELVNGHVHATPKGTLQRNPWSTIQKESEQAIIQIGSKLGLNPRARQIMGASNATGEAALDKF
jgi:P27 family predicted phage terminase small subunit